MGAAGQADDRLVTNNVALVRLSLALVICVGHAAQLSGEPALAPLADALSTPLRVSAFFVLSGFLIFRSYDRSASLASYARRRVWRIYPMYAAVVLLRAFGLGLVTQVSASEYFSDRWLRYVGANLTFAGFVQPTLPGVFQENVRPEVNGALWTMKIEVLFYAVVPLFAWLFARAGRMRVMAATYLLSIAYGGVMSALAQRHGGIYDELARQLPGQLTFLGGRGGVLLPADRRTPRTGDRACVRHAAGTRTLPAARGRPAGRACRRRDCRRAVHAGRAPGPCPQRLLRAVPRTLSRHPAVRARRMAAGTSCPVPDRRDAGQPRRRRRSRWRRPSSAAAAAVEGR